MRCCLPVLCFVFVPVVANLILGVPAVDALDVSSFGATKRGGGEGIDGLVPPWVLLILLLL